MNTLQKSNFFISLIIFVALLHFYFNNQKFYKEKQESLIHYYEWEIVSLKRQLQQPKEIKRFTDEDLYWLSLCIYYESRGESKIGKIFVGQVVINRKYSSKFPDEIKDVVVDKNQFSWYNGNIVTPKNKTAWKHCQSIAKDLLELKYLGIHNALWYHNTSVNPSWCKELHFICRIDNHLFYKENL